MPKLKFFTSPITIFVSFAFISLWLGWQGWISESIPFGDVSFIYEYWGKQVINAGYVVGINESWVYPAFALVPIILPALIFPWSYPLGWIILVISMNAGVVAVLCSARFAQKIQVSTRHLRQAAWFYLLFLIALGPISVSRLEAVVSPLVVIGMLVLFIWPATAGAILAAATWIKVWPAAILIPAVIALKARVRLLQGIIMFSLAVIAIAVILGGGQNLFSFLTDQSVRGLQIESPLASPLLWLAISKVPGYGIYYDNQILTYQVTGDLAAPFASGSNVLLAISVVGFALWGLFLSRKRIQPKVVIPSISLLLILSLMVFNKVGSPQYELWLLAPVLVGLVFLGRVFICHAIFALVIAGITQLIYPYNYIPVLYLDPFVIGVLSLRNALLLAFLVFAVWRLYTESKREIWLPTKSDSIKNAS